MSKSVLAQFVAGGDEAATGPPLSLPLDITTQQLTLLVNDLLDNVRRWRGARAGGRM